VYTGTLVGLVTFIAATMFSPNFWPLRFLENYGGQRSRRAEGGVRAGVGGPCTRGRSPATAAQRSLNLIEHHQNPGSFHVCSTAAHTLCPLEHRDKAVHHLNTWLLRVGTLH
jgi:hypothetical protein